MVSSSVSFFFLLKVGMDINDVDDEEFGFSRNYFLAKESGTSGKKSGSKLFDIDLVSEEVFPKLS